MLNEEIVRLGRRAKEVMKTPYRHGHSDVGDTLIRFLNGIIPFDEAMKDLDGLEETYKQAKG